MQVPLNGSQSYGSERITGRKHALPARAKMESFNVQKNSEVIQQIEHIFEKNVLAAEESPKTPAKAYYTAARDYTPAATDIENSKVIFTFEQAHSPSKRQKTQHPTPLENPLPASEKVIQDRAKLNWKAAIQGVISQIHTPSQKWKSLAELLMKIGEGGKQPLLKMYWIEAIHPKHQAGFSSIQKIAEWKNSGTSLDYFTWEEKNYGPDATPEKWQVTYLTQAEKKEFESQIVNGIVLKNDNPISTVQDKTLFKGAGVAIFIIDSTGKLYISSHEQGKFHHSSLSSGKTVIFSGEIQINQEGVITSLSNQSGHYRLGIEDSLTMLKYMEERGVNLEAVSFTLLGKHGSFLYPSAKKFLESHGEILPSKLNHGVINLNSKGEVEFITFEPVQKNILKKWKAQANALEELKNRGIDLSSIMVIQQEQQTVSRGDFFLETMISNLYRT